MAGKDHPLKWDHTTAGNNQDIGNIGIQGSNFISNVDNAFREGMTQEASAFITRIVDKAANSYTAVLTDHNQLWRATGACTFNLTAAATLTSGWCLHFIADGGAITFDGNSSETIDGAITLVVEQGKSGTIFCNGTAFYTKTGFNGAVPSANRVNYLINGDGAINQRNASTGIADDTYGLDRHFVLTQTSTITVGNTFVSGSGYFHRITQAQASAQRMGLSTIIEVPDGINLRGKTITIGGKLRYSNAAAVRYAILEWDTPPTSDVVGTWTSGTYTEGNFFINSANLTVVSVGTLTPSAATVTDFQLTGVIGGGTANCLIQVFIWTEGTAAQNSTLDVQWYLCEGDATGESNPVARRTYADELRLCQRYFYAWTGALRTTCHRGSDLSQRAGYIKFPVSMRAAPSNSGDTYSAAWSTGPTISADTEGANIEGDTAADTTLMTITAVNFSAEL